MCERWNWCHRRRRLEKFALKKKNRKTARFPENPGATAAVSAAAATPAGLGDLELSALTEEDAHLIPRGWEVVEGGKT